MQFSRSGSTPSALPGHDLEPVRCVGMGADKQWLQDAVGAHRLGQLRQGRRIDDRPRLERVGLQEVERNLPDAGALRLRLHRGIAQ